ncbi:MAG: MFS transporter [Candidatus Doudnabacteria bacterium]
METISRKQEWLILFAAIIASGMAFLDSSVVNIAIPAIQNQFHASFDNMLWVVNAFPLLLASLLLVSGSLSDRYGRKKVFVLGIIVFTLASILCALAQSIIQLAVFRALQGIGAAMMIPGSLTIINLSFPESRRGRAIGLWSGFSGGIAAIGPFIGGWLVQTLSWRAIFYINLPLGILALALTVYAVAETKNAESRKLDVWGTLLILLGLFGIAYGLMTGPVKTWQDRSVLAGLLGGLACLIAFVFVERKTAEPLVPSAIFRSKLVLGANLATLFLYGALNSLIFFVVLNMQQVQDFSPLKAGLALLPAVLIITFLSGFGGTVADKIGPRLPMIVGPLLVSAGTVWMIFAGVGADYFKAFLPGLILFGLGMAVVIAPLTKSALMVPEHFSGSASGVNNAVARVAALLAVAVLGAVAISFFGSSLRNRIAQTSLAVSEKQQILAQSDRLGGIEVAENFTPQEKLEAKTAIKRSFVDSFRIVLAITAVLAFISSIISAILIY